MPVNLSTLCKSFQSSQKNSFSLPSLTAVHWQTRNQTFLTLNTNLNRFHRTCEMFATIAKKGEREGSSLLFQLISLDMVQSSVPLKLYQFCEIPWIFIVWVSASNGSISFALFDLSRFLRFTANSNAIIIYTATNTIASKV